MLFGPDGFQAKLIAFVNRRQPIARGIAFVIFFFFFLHGLVGGEVPIEFLD